MKKWIFILLAIVVSFGTIYSQNSCPEDYSNWDKSSTNFDLGQYGNTASSEFFYRNNLNNSFDIVMDWSTFNNDNDFISNSALRKIFELQAINQLVPNIDVPYSCTINVYYKTECNVRASVYLNLETEYTIECCDPGKSIDNDIISFVENGTNYKIIQFSYGKPCGEKCCKRVYNCSRQTTGYSWFTVVSAPTFVSVTNCDNSSNFIDCYTSEPIPCEGDCEKW